jgi:hypothetical protein
MMHMASPAREEACAFSFLTLRHISRLKSDETDLFRIVPAFDCKSKKRTERYSCCFVRTAQLEDGFLYARERRVDSAVARNFKDT